MHLPSIGQHLLSVKQAAAKHLPSIFQALLKHLLRILRVPAKHLEGNNKASVKLQQSIGEALKSIGKASPEDWQRIFDLIAKGR